MGVITRSQSLFAYSNIPAGSVLAWTGPESTVTLVKGIAVSNRQAVTVHVTITLQTSGGLGTVLVMAQDIASGAVVNLQVWHAMNPGDNMYVASSPAGADAWISGSVLQGMPTVVRPSDAAATQPA